MKHWKQTLLASASGVVLASSAYAADLPLKAAAPAYMPVANWTGPYIGGHIGVGSHHSTCNTVGDYNCAGNAEVAAVTNQDTNFLLGVQAGWDWQDRYFVYGIAADWTWTNMKGRTVGSSGSKSWESKVNWLASFRGRAGLALDNNLIYVTGGVAVGEFENNVHIASETNAILKQTRVGWVAGAGFEHKFNRNWSFFAEYLHYDFGNWEQSHSGPTYSYTHKFDSVIDVGRVGMNYRF